MKLIKLYLFLSVGCVAFEHHTPPSKELLEKRQQELETSQKEYEERLKAARLDVLRQTKATTEDTVTPEVEKRKKLIDATRTELFEQTALTSITTELRSTQDQLNMLTSQTAQLLEKSSPRTTKTAQDFFSTVQAYFKNLVLQLKTFFKSPATHDALKDYYDALGTVVKKEIAQSPATEFMGQKDRADQRAAALKNPLADPGYANDLRILQAAQQRLTALFSKRLATNFEQLEPLSKTLKTGVLDRVTSQQIPDLITMLEERKSPRAVNASFAELQNATSVDALFTLLSGEANPYSVLGLQPDATAAQIEKAYQEKSKTVPQTDLKTARDRLMYTKPLIDSLLDFAQQLAKQANAEIKKGQTTYRSILESALENIRKKD